MERSSAPASPGLKLAIIPVTPFQQNCTLLWDPATMRGAVVDPGGDLDAIEDGIGQVGAKIEKIILTHGHMDHAGGAAELKEKLGGIPIEGPHIADKFLLDDLATQGAKYSLDSRNVTPDRWLADGDTVTIAGETFDVYHCPGHSPGSVVLVSPQRRFALVGDVLFRGSIGRTDFAYGDHDALINAIHTKLLPLGDDMQFICGHGPPSTFGRERATNPFLT
jgi:glyoxylase-like metal-dependent hydrolase (beta-lactamase superfamily II)